jgi:hypothetical protein
VRHVRGALTITTNASVFAFASLRQKYQKCLGWIEHASLLPTLHRALSSASNLAQCVFVGCSSAVQQTFQVLSSTRLQKEHAPVRWGLINLGL